jgi:Cdc6-like AAA superfamily ATPase
MTSIDEIILRSINPFDNFRSVNFWHKQQQSEPTVDSIHKEAITDIEKILDQVAKDHQTRTIILDGDGGSGKTYLLGRLKKKLNHKAFFVYIPPFPQTDHIWRHILRYTVDSLVQVPNGKKDSQLLLWLENVLNSIKERSVKDRIFKDDVLDLLRSDRKKFINKLRDIYKQAGIYNADIFFGVLHDLTDTKLYPLACEWLRGDDLSEDSLRDLGIKKSIETEDAARETLANFSRIAGDTLPLVLCFDQLESIALLPDGIQALFNLNTKLSSENSNLLVIISITTNTWESNKSRIDKTHKDRFDKKVDLKPINLNQAESILASRLYSLHHQANFQSSSPIYPVQKEYLAKEFPGGKTSPREVIKFGQFVFQEYKKWLANPTHNERFTLTLGDSEGETDKHLKLLAPFKLLWHDEFNKIQTRITKLRILSSPHLIKTLQETLVALELQGVKSPFLTGTKYASYSLEYKLSTTSGRLGVIWSEDANMTTFFYVMQACKKVVEKDNSLKLYLIRAEELGNQKNQGNKLFLDIFTGSSHDHIKPDITSVHYLETYYSLVRDAREGDLVIGNQTINLKDLQMLIRESRILEECLLLKRLSIIKNGIEPPPPPIKDFLVNLVSTQLFLGRETLIKNTMNAFNTVNESQINVFIKQLCQEKKIQILDPKAKPEAQLICLVPQK